ncbi:hypothetical protein CYMTET_21080, partial [Cymbomonas tetramitiformis]
MAQEKRFGAAVRQFIKQSLTSIPRASPRNPSRQSVDVEATQPPDIDSASPPKPDARRELLARQASIAGVFNTAFEELDMPESGKSKPSQHSERSTPQDARERVISPFRQEADARERLISPDRQEADARSSDLVIEQYNDIVNVQLQRKLRVGLDSMFAAQMELQNERLAIAQGLQQMWALLEEGKVDKTAAQIRDMHNFVQNSNYRLSSSSLEAVSNEMQQGIASLRQLQSMWHISLGIYQVRQLQSMWHISLSMWRVRQLQSIQHISLGMYR